MFTASDLSLLFVKLLLLFVLIQILFYLWKCIRMHWQRHVFQMTKHIPGPPSIPIVGNIHYLIGTLEDIWIKLRKFAEIYPRMYKLWAGNRLSIMLIDPHDVEVLLSSTKNIQKSEAYLMLKLWLGDGLLISSGTKWKSRRRILTNAFHFNILNQFVNTFETQSDQSVTSINAECDRDYLNVTPVVIEHTLHSLCETTMGIKIDTQSEKVIKYKQAIHNFGEVFVDRILKPWLYIDFIYYFFSKSGAKMLVIVKTLKEFTKQVINERLNSWDDTKIITVESASGKQKLPMMDLLIADMKTTGGIDYDGILEEVDTFMFEGHDTTTMGLSFFLMLLANHPDVQEKIYNETKSILGDTNRKATYEDLQKMQYLERCIKESLRLYPAVPIIGRQLDEDLILNDMVLPKDIYVYVSIYDLHHNKKYWPNPEQFDPDRFLPENTSNRHQFAYVPFSAGSRNCIGQRFAMLEMKSFVSKILQYFILLPVDTPDTIKFKADLILRSSNNIRVKFQRR